MPTPFESALLNLKLFDLRREPTLREARAWFIKDFNPRTLDELAATVSGERNPSFRMVLGYWDMAASLVTSGAIDPDAFRAAHGEIFLTFAKVRPFLDEIRTLSEPEFCAHLEKVVMSDPAADEIIRRRLAAIRTDGAGHPPQGDRSIIARKRRQLRQRRKPSATRKRERP